MQPSQLTILVAAAGLVAVCGTSTAQTVDLPLPARYAVSEHIGCDLGAYHLSRSPDGFRAANPRRRLEARFTERGVEVVVDDAHFGLRVAAFGRCDRLSALALGKPTAQRNRVEYRRGAVVEWYANGPLGLQQGFTVEQAPTAGDGPLTLALALGEGIAATVDADARGATLANTNRRGQLRYSGLVAYDRCGRDLDARLEVDGARLLIRVDDTGAEYPIVIDPLFERAKLTASDGAALDNLGAAVAISGDTVVVGASQFDASSSIPGIHGKAYVFEKPASGWATTTENAQLTASDGAQFDRFGSSVGISGDTIVVGARVGDGATLNQGAAYVFEKPGASWATMTETAKLTASDGAAFDRFGLAAAIDGDTIVVGACFHDVGGRANQGAAYVFEKQDTGWSTMTETAKLTASDGAADDQFGFAVAIRGQTIAVGAHVDDVGGQADQGSVYVFVAPGTGWSNVTETIALRASDGADDDQYGGSVALEGSALVVGALEADVGGNTDQGSAYVHRFGFGSYGAGTAGAGAQVPQLVGDGPATIGSGVSLDVSNGRGGAPGAMLLGSGVSSQVSIPLLGGTVMVLPVVSLPMVLGGAAAVAGDGSGALPLAIPANPGVIGVNLNFQGVFVDGAAPAGLSMTAAVDMWIG